MAHARGPSAAGGALQSLRTAAAVEAFASLHSARFGNADGMKRWRRQIAVVFALVTLVGGSSGATAREPTAATPLDSPGNWVTSDDYPRMALEDDKQGVVRFVLDIDLNGRPTECRILQSSGDEELDLTACNLITSRARFSPARDTRGHAVPSSYKNSVRWVLPKTAPAPQSTALEFSVIVGVDGSVSNCKIVRAEGDVLKVIAQKKGPCDKPPAFEPFLDGSGQAVAKRVTVLHEVKVEAP